MDNLDQNCNFRVNPIENINILNDVIRYGHPFTLSGANNGFYFIHVEEPKEADRGFREVNSFHTPSILKGIHFGRPTR